METEINEQTAISGLTQSDLKESEKRNKINQILLIEKQTVSKCKYGKSKT